MVNYLVVKQQTDYHTDETTYYGTDDDADGNLEKDSAGWKSAACSAIPAHTDYRLDSSMCGLVPRASASE